MDVFGSYLKMQTCLSYAAILHAEDVVESLLAVAKHDPRHKEVLKQMSRTNSMIFYEPVSFIDTEACTFGLKVANTAFSLKNVSPCYQQFCSDFKRSNASQKIAR